MTLPVPLGVRLKTARGTKRVTRELRSLSFRSTTPGGFASATFSLDRPLTLQPEELNYFGNVYVEDLRNGEVAWEGRIEDLGRGAGDDGQVWQVAAVGTSAHARDKTVPRIWVDSSTERWRRSGLTNLRSARVDNTDLETDEETPAVDLTWPEGTTIQSTAPASVIDAMYRGLYDCGQQLGRLRVQVVNGVTTSNRENRISTRNNPSGSTTTADSATWNTTAATLAASRGGSPAITADHDVAHVRVAAVAGGTVTVTGNAWGEFYNFVVRSVLKDINGTDLTAGYPDNFVLSSEVVTDMIGRGDLFNVDPTTSTITTGVAHIDQMGNPLGWQPAEVLDALIELESGSFYWAIWESQSSGKYRLEWSTWPTTIRYEADVKDGIDSPGSGDGLHNQALVAYTDWAGRERTTTRTSTVQTLIDAGLTRTLYLNLTGEKNSAANAQQAGDQALLEHAYPPNAGTLRIARPISDFIAGRRVMPWEIRPGNLIRVRGIRPNVNSLNATVRDGVTVFRIVAVEYDAGSATATLELDSYSVTLARQLANLQKRDRRRRR